MTPSHLPIFWSPKYAVPGSFDTAAKSAAVADAIRSDETLPGARVIAPPMSGITEMARSVHSADYVDEVLAGFVENGLKPSTRAAFTALASASGMVAAADEVLSGLPVSGSLSSGMHHAGVNFGAGFCTLNGLAMAAQRLVDCGVSPQRVLVLDLDAHHGGGTEEILTKQHDLSEVRHVDVSVSSFDDWKVLRPNTHSETVRHSGLYLARIVRALNQVDGPIDVVIYNAGMDPYEGCGIGGLHGITSEVLAEREAIVGEWTALRGAKLIFGLAGGYTGPHCPPAKLTDLHMQTVRAMNEALAS